MVIVARIGDSSSAKEYLEQLENDDAIKDIVYCSADSLNKQQALLTPGDDISERADMTRVSIVLVYYYQCEVEADRSISSQLIQLLAAALPQ